MEYNEKQFQCLANKLALTMWIIVEAILTVAYIIEVAGGKKEVDFLIVFLILGWIPVIIGAVMLKVKGMHTQIFKEYCSRVWNLFYIRYVYC